jgi:hypothetical protein
MSFEQHVNSIVAKARLRVSTLYRGFLSRHLTTMKLAYITYIRPFRNITLLCGILISFILSI